MNNNKTIQIFLGAILLVALISVIGIFQKPVQPLGSVDFNVMVGTISNTAVSVSTTSTAILSANVGRVYSQITNDSDTIIYLGIGEDAVMNEGIRLSASGGLYEITPDNLFIGAVNAICSTTSKSVLVIEK
jgi:hypothetical protein